MVTAASIVFDIDGTLWVQVILFATTGLILHFTLFQNYLETLDERTRLTEGNREEAEEAQVLADEYREEYETEMNSIRREAKKLLDERRQEGQDKKDEMVSEVQSELDEKLAEERRKIQNNIEQAEQKLEQRAQNLAESMVAKVVPQG